MSFACSEIIWLRGLLGELGFPQVEPTPLHADNTSVIQIAANPVFHERTKHIEVDCHSIHETYDARVISLPHISTTLQIADVFTKALSKHRHHFLVDKLMLLDHITSISGGISVAEIMDQNYRNYGYNYEIYFTIISVLSFIYVLTYIRILAVSVLAVYIFLPK